MLQAGQILEERYQLREQLRAQPTRQTWLAADHQATAPSQSVIIKFLAFGRGMTWDEMKLFEREAQVLKQLNHPQIPQYLDSFHIHTPESWLGLIEEYIPGRNLQTLIDKGQRFSKSQIYDLASQTLEILIYLHEQNPPILHRDIKPSNLILTPSHTVYLVDFGAVQNQLPQSGGSFTVVGTYGYTPLEQFGGQAVPASDLYSLGATLLHLLTGLAPAELAQTDLWLQFRDGQKPTNVLQTASNGHRIRLTNHLARWLKKMTAPALTDRFDSARAALFALTPLSSSSADPLTNDVNDSPRLAVHANSEHLRINISPNWSSPLPGLKDIAGISLLTLLGPVAILILALLPIGMVYTRNALFSGDIEGISIGLLLLCIGGIPWFTGLNWLKQNITSILIESVNSHLLVKYQILGWTYWQKSRLTADITDIYDVPLNKEERIVTVSFRQKTSISLGSNLNLQDSQHLIQTLQQWIDRYG